jgi:hypothetical protein
MFMFRYHRWVAAVKNEPIREFDVVCSDHFSTQDFNEGDVMKMNLMPLHKFKAPRLKDDAVPHVFNQEYYSDSKKNERKGKHFF